MLGTRERKTTRGLDARARPVRRLVVAGLVLAAVAREGAAIIVHRRRLPGRRAGALGEARGGQGKSGGQQEDQDRLAHVQLPQIGDARSGRVLTRKQIPQARGGGKARPIWSLWASARLATKT